MVRMWMLKWCYDGSNNVCCVGQVNSIESYLTSWVSGGYKGGASVHYGTWESAVYGLGFANEIRHIRSKLFAERLPTTDPKLKKRWAFLLLV